VREKRRLRALRIACRGEYLVTKRDEVTGEWIKLRNVEFHDLYSSANIIRVIKSNRMKWAGHVARMGESKGVYRFLVGKPNGKGPLGRPRHTWENRCNINP